jgi:hypothetical protein
VQGFFQNLLDAVLLAERALLYTLSFGFNVEQPYKSVLAIIKRRGLDTLEGENLPQVAWNLVNDSWSTTLCLRVIHYCLPQLQHKIHSATLCNFLPCYFSPAAEVIRLPQIVAVF